MHAAIFQIFYQLTLTFWEIFVQCKICSLRVFTNLVNLRNVHNFLEFKFNLSITTAPLITGRGRNQTGPCAPSLSSTIFYRMSAVHVVCRPIASRWLRMTFNNVSDRPLTFYAACFAHRQQFTFEINCTPRRAIHLRSPVFCLCLICT